MKACFSSDNNYTGFIVDYRWYISYFLSQGIPASSGDPVTKPSCALQAEASSQAKALADAPRPSVVILLCGIRQHQCSTFVCHPGQGCEPDLALSLWRMLIV